LLPQLYHILFFFCLIFFSKKGIAHAPKTIVSPITSICQQASISFNLLYTALVLVPDAEAHVPHLIKYIFFIPFNALFISFSGFSFVRVMAFLLF